MNTHALLSMKRLKALNPQSLKGGEGNTAKARVLS